MAPAGQQSPLPVTLYTVGHSNRSPEDFLTLIEAHAVRGIADVRAFPASRHWPHFNREPLAAALAEHGVRYDWLPQLGGRRRALRADSPHTAWTVAAFRNYADYADTDEFRRGLDALLAAARLRRTAFLCAEALYWRCHRRLIADQLVLRGHEVLHIDSPTRAVPHRLPDFARIAGGRLIYDGGTQLEML